MFPPIFVANLLLSSVFRVKKVTGEIKGEIMLHPDTSGYIGIHLDTSKAKLLNMSSNIRIKKVCQHCGTEFIAKTTVTKYCGDNCAKRAYKVRKKKEKVESTPSIDEQLVEFRSNALDKKEFLNIKETCQLLGASRMTVYRQIKRGNIPAFKLGRRTIIMRSELESLCYNESNLKTA